jgi:hypothetical protein
MAENLLPSGQAYAYMLLEKWDDIISESENFRFNYLMGQLDKAQTSKYISKLTRLWMELYIETLDRTDLGDLTNEFEPYMEFYRNPILLLQPENAPQIFEMELVMRKAIAATRITQFERGVK